MNPVLHRFLEHVLFWAAVLAFYTVYFGSRQDDYGQSLFFVALLLPITMGTTYAVVYWLVPRYLLTGRLGRFVLYLGYSLLLSVHLELSLLVGLYITVADYQALFVEPNLVDLMDVLIGMYIVVFGALSLHTLRRWQRTRSDRESLLQENEQMQEELVRAEDGNASVIVRVDRRNVNILLSDILFVESQRDYLLIHTTDGKLMTKMTLSTFEQEVEGRGFVRIHRSYLIRARAVSSFTASEVDIGDQTLPIGRSHRESAASALAEQ
jgi:two-component system response regulator LytT